LIKLPIKINPMATVKFTSNLKRFFPDLDTMNLNSDNVAKLLDEINEKHRGLKDYIVEENGALRKHVNIFIGEEMINHRETLKDSLKNNDEVYIMQALSGG